MTDRIKKGSKVLVNAIKASKPESFEMLHFDQYWESECVVVNVWKYPPDDPKFEVLVLHPSA